MIAPKKSEMKLKGMIALNFKEGLRNRNYKTYVELHHNFRVKKDFSMTNA